MSTSFLFTQCLQNDFVEVIGPHTPAPNMLHIGNQEALRLLGENPAEGPVAQCMQWAYRQADEHLRIVHIRDWHDQDDPQQQQHLQQFDVHCLAGTRGAEFAFVELDHHAKEIAIIDSTSLNDFLETPLPALLAPYRQHKLKFGIIGVWTDAKVSFLAYELRTRFPDAGIAVCSALTASNSRTKHFIALEQLQILLDVQVFHTVGGFTEFLGGTDAVAPTGRFSSHIEVSVDQPINHEDRRLLQYLFRHSKKVEARQLDGGFSGNVVLGTKSVDSFGHSEVPHVVKIGPRELIGKERTAFERIESVLGNNAPRVADFGDLGSRGAIKYRYASMNGTRATTFQKVYGSGCSLRKLRSTLKAVFSEQLGRFYLAGQAQKCDLLAYYAFDSARGATVRAAVANLGVREEAGGYRLSSSLAVPDLCQFYERDLALLQDRTPDYVPFSYVHGDLNGANILIDDHENVWLIDFFHTHYGHALKDLVKLENDLLYIFTPVTSEAELDAAVSISDILLAIEDLAAPLPDAASIAFAFPQFRRCYETVCLLHSFYASIIRTERDPLQYFIALLRYAVHTLSFEESNDWQKRWALYTAAQCAQKIVAHDKRNRTLRIDWLPQQYTEPGRLGLTILPGRRDKGRDLADDIAALQAAGASHVVTLATAQELVDYGVSELSDAYARAGLQWYHLPILDQKVPDFRDMNRLLGWLAGELAGGARVVVHCVGGLGRAGTVAACYLKKRHCPAGEALAIVRQSRSSRAVETQLQEEFVTGFTGEGP